METVKAEFIKASFTAVLSILLVAPITLFTGYYLGQYLRAPNLEPQYADAVVQVNHYKLPDEEFRTLKSNKSIMAALTTSPVYFESREDTVHCKDWLKLGEIYDECIPIIHRVFEELKILIQVTLVQWKSAKSALENNDPTKFSTINIGNPLDFNAIKNIQDSVERKQIKSALKIAELRINAVQRDFDSIVRIAKSFEATIDDNTERTGLVFINVGVLNTGDSEGVVYPGAVVKFGDSELNFTANDYVVIKAHSFNNIEFSEVTGNNSPSDTKKWRSIVQKHMQEPFEILIQSANGEHAISGRLPE